jgi:heptosyltransferase-2
VVSPRRVGAPTLERAERILVYRVDEIGDVVLTTPFLRELRRSAPQAHITLVVKPSSRSLVETSRHVDEILTYDYLHRRVFVRPDRYVQIMRFWRDHLRGTAFDLALVPRRDHDYYGARLLAFLSGAPWRVAYEPSGPSEPVLTPGGAPWLTHLVRDRTPRHEVESVLNFLRAIGGSVGTSELEVRLTPQDESAADRVLGAYRRDQPLVALGIGAGARRRLWPVQRFVEVGRFLQRQLGAQVVVIGGPSDAANGSRVVSALGYGALNLAGHLSLRQTAAVLRRCRLYVGNDSGPMHLAASQSTGVVEVSCHPIDAPTNHPNAPERFGPWRVPAAIVQPMAQRSPCRAGCRVRWPHCILGVSTAQVLDAIDTLWPATAAA